MDKGKKDTNTVEGKKEGKVCGMNGKVNKKHAYNKKGHALTYVGVKQHPAGCTVRGEQRHCTRQE